MSYVTVLNTIPKKLTAGESVSWSVSLSDYPASDSWVLTYTLIKTGTRLQIVADADGDDHLVEVAADVTAAYAVGEYEYQAHVFNGTERYQVGAGVIEILTDFAEHADGYDARSNAKKVLDALEAVIEGRASMTQMVQKVGNTEVQHLDPEKLEWWRNQYAVKYRAEQVAAGYIKSRRTIKTRFV